MKTNKKHILVADDEEAMLKSLRYILRAEDYRVTTAKDGNEAFEQITNAEKSVNPVDLLVLDIQMPELNGLELIEKLGRNNLNIPTLVISGYGDKEMIVELMRLGCSEFLDKPFEEDELFYRIKKVFEREESLKEEIKRRIKKIENNEYTPVFIGSPISITIKEKNNYTYVEVFGKLTEHSTPALRRRIEQLIDKGRSNFLFNLSNVPYANSSGISLLIYLWKQIKKRNGSLSIISTSHLRYKIEELNLNRLFRVFKSEEEFINRVLELPENA